MRDGQAAGGFADRVGNGGGESVRLHAGAHDPPQGRDAGVEFGNFVGHLRDWDVHGGTGVLIESAIARVADNTDHLAGRLGEDRSHARSDNDAVVEGIAVGPELAGHGFINYDHAGSGSVVAVGEIASAEDGNLEDIEITPGDGEVSRASGVGIVAVGAAHDVEGEAEASLQRETAGGRGGGDTGNGADALSAVVDHLGDSAGFLKAVAAD